MSEDSGEGDYIEVDLSQITIPDDPRELFEKYEVQTVTDDEKPEVDDKPGEPLRALYDAATTVEQSRMRSDPEFWGRLRAEADRADAWLAAHWGGGRTADGPEAGAAGSKAQDGWAPRTVEATLAALPAGELKRIEPDVGMVGDTGKGLLYSGRVNGLAGDSGGGKSWIALAIGVERMQAARTFFYVDFEDTEEAVVLRLVDDLQTDPQLVAAQFRYVHPEVHSTDGVQALVDAVRAEDQPYVVIDSTGESLAAAGRNPNADEDVAAWFQQLAHPLAQAGATVLLLDHQAKTEDGGLWPIGSQRKRAAITGIQYMLRVDFPFSREVDGQARLVVAKDRHGAYEVHSTAAVVTFRHPVSSTATPEGFEVVRSEALALTFGQGKTAEQTKAEQAAKAAAQLDTDVAALDALDPAPKTIREVKDRLGWGGTKATEVMREWRSRRS